MFYQFKNVFLFGLNLLLVFSLQAQYQNLLPSDSLLFWVRSDSNLVMTGTDITQWNDLSGNNNHAVSDFSTPPQHIVNEFNGHPVVRFNGSTTAFKTPAMEHFANKRGTIFIIMKINGPGNGASGFGSVVSTWVNSGVTFQFGARPTTYNYYDGVGLVAHPIATTPPNQWGILTLRRSYDDTMHLYKSGIPIAASPIANNQPSIRSMYIGYSGSYEVLNGDIAEIIIYNRALDEQEFIQVNGYLANRYGLNNHIATPSSSNQEHCGPTTFTLTASGGQQYHWYNTSTGGQLLHLGSNFTTSLLNTTDTFYVANYNDTLESVRTPVITTIHPLPSIPVITQIGTNLVVNTSNNIQWYLNGVAISNATTNNHLPTQAGNYTVVVTDNHNCSATSAPFAYTSTHSVNINSDQIIKHYPNPCDRLLTIEFLKVQHNIKVQIANISGQLIYYQKQENKRLLNLDLQDLPSGIYTVQLILDATTETFKVFKK